MSYLQQAALGMPYLAVFENYYALKSRAYPLGIVMARPMRFAGSALLRCKPHRSNEPK